MPNPTPPSNDSNFIKRHNELLSTLIKKIDKSNTHSSTLEKLIKEMVVYFKVLEKSYNKGTIASKMGKADSLYNDKGFFKLLQLVEGLSDTTRKAIDRYSSGKRLMSTDKQALAKFSQEMAEAIKESNEKIGLPISDLLDLMTKNMKDSEVSDKMKLDLLEQLSEYSKEDIALSQDLQQLIDKSIKDGRLSNDTLTEIVDELQKTREDYKENQSFTYAPMKKIKDAIENMSTDFDKFKNTLTESQRDFGKELSDRFLKKDGGFYDLLGNVVDGGMRALAVGMSDLPILKHISPLVAGASTVAGIGAAGYLKTRGIKNIGTDARAVGKLASGATTKAIEVSRGLAPKVGKFAGKATPWAILADEIYGYQKGFRASNGSMLEKVKGGRSQMFSGLTMGMVSKDTFQKLGDKMDEAIANPLSTGISNLQMFVEAQNKKIFGSSLNLGQLLSSVLPNILKGGLEVGQVAGSYVGAQATKMTDKVIQKAIPSVSGVISKGKEAFGYREGMPSEGRVSSQFGMRKHPLSGQVKAHTGIDIAGREGSAVKAALGGGKVVYAGQMAGYGNMVAVRTPDGRIAKYGHLRDIQVKQGQTLGANQLIGGMGHTGASAGTHLHFETTKAGVSTKQALMKSGTGYKQGLYDNPLDVLDEYKSTIKSRPDTVSNMPSKPKTTTKETTPQPPPVVVQGGNPSGKTDRKLNSDSSLLNFFNNYGVMH